MPCDCDRLCLGQLRHAMLHLVMNKTAFNEVQGAVRQEPCLYQCCHSGSHIRSRMRWGAPAITLLGKLEEMGSPAGRSMHAPDVAHQDCCSTACFDGIKPSRKCTILDCVIATSSSTGSSWSPYRVYKCKQVCHQPQYHHCSGPCEAVGASMLCRQQPGDTNH
jgi:hypothetical protein